MEALVRVAFLSACATTTPRAENAARAARLNALESAAEYGETQFSALSAAEFKEKYLSGYALSRTSQQPHRVLPDLLTEYAAAPVPVDWVAKGAVTPVKDQGVCGSCWSFSTVGAIEGLHFVKTGELVSLSEQQLIDCDRVSPNNGCNGGYPPSAFEWIAARGSEGIATEASYDYSGFQSTCVNNTSAVRTGAVITNWTAISNSSDEIAAQLATRGPLSIAVNAAGLQQYKRGVACPLAALCDPTQPNHAMTLVGWGVDGGQEYWKVKNSWGAAFGEDGYVRYCKGKGACGINLYVTAALDD